MNYNIISFLLGLIIGYFIMYKTSNIVIYHGYNSNKIREQKFILNGKTYHFKPTVIGNAK